MPDHKNPPADPSQVDQTQNMGEPDSTPKPAQQPPQRPTPAAQPKSGHTPGVGVQAITAGEIAFYDNQIDEALLPSAGTVTGTATAFKTLLASIRTEQANIGASDRTVRQLHEHVVDAARQYGRSTS